MSNDVEQKEQQKELWEKLLRNDKFSSMLRLPPEYRHQQWDALRTLGAFGEVRLLVDPKKPETVVAAKCINVCASGKEEELYRKLRQEAFIMRILRKSKYIIRYIGMRYDNGHIEMFLEYADGGELFDHIEPDSGMPARKAQGFFRQIITGLKHIHSMGIVHRDIKPENLLLMKNGQLKIGDFGLATLFRHRGVERKLKTRCGTVQYLSPQVLASDYRGEPSDIWSCGIVLVAMLTGELPWEEAVRTSPAFKVWLTQFDWRYWPPWDRLFGAISNLLRKMLDVNERRRITIREIEDHEFFVEDANYEIPSAEAMRGPSGGERTDIKSAETTAEDVANIVSLGENLSDLPGPSKIDDPSPSLLEESVVMKTEEPEQKKVKLSDKKKQSEGSAVAMSQPVPSRGISQAIRHAFPNFEKHPLALLARRMTRFCVTKRANELMPIIKDRLDIKYTCVRRAPNIMSISGPRNRMCFVVTVYEMMGDDGRKVMVDCRRSHGDGIEFKRAFLDFKKRLSDVICEAGNLWLEQQGLVEKFDQ
uniref:non-specific serine/threonine protein kinase n=1 Tax=Setaria digitata TaxID=48799 RepID=A0A915Q7T3_9BILA